MHSIDLFKKYSDILKEADMDMPGNPISQADGHADEVDDTNNGMDMPDDTMDQTPDDSQESSDFDSYDLAQELSDAVSKEGSDDSPERISSIIDKYLQQNNLKIVKSQPGLADQEGNI
jgi:hypothetical protein